MFSVSPKAKEVIQRKDKAVQIFMKWLESGGG